MSHHATEDIAVMRALPNIEVIVPGTELGIHRQQKSFLAEMVCHIFV